MLNKEKILILISIILLSYNSYIISNIYQTGYIINEYDYYPLEFYFSIFFCFLIGSYLIYSTKKIVYSIILFIINIQIFLIPICLGYFFQQRADYISYASEYSDIIKNKIISNWDIYPFFEIVGALLYSFSGIMVNQLSRWISLIFSLLFTVNLIIYSKNFLNKKNDTYLIAIISSFILYLSGYHYSNAPNSLSFAIIPIILLLFHNIYKKSNDYKNNILLIIFIISLPFTHPFIVLFFYFIQTVNLFIMLYMKKPIKNLLYIFGLYNLSVLSWIFYNQFTNKSLERSWLSFIERLSTPTYFQTLNQLQLIKMDLLGFINYLLFEYGRYLIPTFIISIYFLLITLNKVNLKDDKSNYFYLFIFYITSVVVEILLLFNPIITHQPDRIINLNFILFFQIALFSYSLHGLIKIRIKQINNIIIPLILTIIFSLSFFNTFASSNNYSPNGELTLNEVIGVKWLTRNSQDNIIVGTPISQMKRFYEFLDVPTNGVSFLTLKDHLGYDVKNSTFSSNILNNNENIYIVLLTLDERLYTDVSGYNVVNRFNSEDFNKLKNDYTVNKIYSSLNIDIFNSFK